MTVSFYHTHCSGVISTPANWCVRWLRLGRRQDPERALFPVPLGPLSVWTWHCERLRPFQVARCWGTGEVDCLVGVALAVDQQVSKWWRAEAASRRASGSTVSMPRTNVQRPMVR